MKRVKERAPSKVNTRLKENSEQTKYYSFNITQTTNICFTKSQIQHKKILISSCFKTKRGRTLD